MFTPYTPRVSFNEQYGFWSAVFVTEWLYLTKKTLINLFFYSEPITEVLRLHY